jgi:hypothetical protein
VGAITASFLPRKFRMIRLPRWDEKKETGGIASSLCAVFSSGNQ